MTKKFDHFSKPERMVPCKCAGGCGLSFVYQTNKRSQKYAEGCPVRAAARKALVKKCSNNQVERERNTTVYQCACGKCGLSFVRHGGRYGKRRFAPECPNSRNARPLHMADRKVSKVCGTCFNISDRRAKPFCKECKNPFAPE